MDVETILRLPEADDFRAITILDYLRSDVKKGADLPLPYPSLFSMLQTRLLGQASGSVHSKARMGFPSFRMMVSEEVLLATIQLLLEILHSADVAEVRRSSGGEVCFADDQGLVAGVLSVLPAVCPHLGRDRVRRATNVMIAAALKRGGTVAGQSLADLLIEKGLEADDEGQRKAVLQLCADLFRPGGYDNLPIESFAFAVGKRLKDSSPAVGAAAEKAMQRIKLAQQAIAGAGSTPTAISEVAQTPGALQISGYSMGVTVTPPTTAAPSNVAPAASSPLKMRQSDEMPDSGAKMTPAKSLHGLPSLSSPPMLSAQSSNSTVSHDALRDDAAASQPSPLCAGPAVQLNTPPASRRPTMSQQHAFTDAPAMRNKAGSRLQDMSSSMVVGKPAVNNVSVDQPTSFEQDSLANLMDNSRAHMYKSQSSLAAGCNASGLLTEEVKSALPRGSAITVAGAMILDNSFIEENSGSQSLQSSPIRGKLDLLKKRASRQASRSRRVVSAYAQPVPEDAMEQSEPVLAAEVDDGPTLQRDKFGRSRLGAYSAAPHLRSSVTFDKAGETEQTGLQHTRWGVSSEPSHQLSSASTVTAPSVRETAPSSASSMVASRVLRRAIPQNVSSAGPTTYGLNSINSAYDAAAIAAEFGSDPYASYPASPSKEFSEGGLDAAYLSYGSAPGGRAAGRTDGRRMAASISSAPPTVEYLDTNSGGVTPKWGRTPGRNVARFGARRGADGEYDRDSAEAFTLPDIRDSRTSFARGGLDVASDPGYAQEVATTSSASVAPRIRAGSLGAPTEVYTPSDQLARLTMDSDTALQCAVKLIASDDWEKQFEGLNILRQIVTQDPEFLSSGQISSMIPRIVVAGDSLRSTLAKNAMIAIADLFRNVGRAMDATLEAFGVMLLKRATDTAEFISTAADGALAAMVLYANEMRMIGMLCNASSHKNASIRLKAAIWISRASMKIGSRFSTYPRELERVVQLAAKYMSEGNPEARHAGQRTLFHLLRLGIIDDRYLQRSLQDKGYTRVQSMLEKASPPTDSFDLLSAVDNITRNPGEDVKPDMSASLTSPDDADDFAPRPRASSGIPLASPVVHGMMSSGIAGRHRASVRMPRVPSAATSHTGGYGGGASSFASEPVDGVDRTDHHTSPDAPTTVSTTTTAAAARSRRSVSRPRGPTTANKARSHAADGSPALGMDAFTGVNAKLAASDWKERISGLNELCSMMQHDKAALQEHAIFVADAISQRIADTHSKVALSALQSADMLLPHFTEESMDRAAPLLLSALAQGLASSNRQVVESANGVLDHVVYGGSPASIVQPLVTQIRHGNVKLRGLMLERLAATVPDVAISKPQMISRNILPAVFPLLEDVKSDIRTAVSSIVSHSVAAIGADGVMDCAHSYLSASGGTGLTEMGLEKLKRMVGRR